MPFKTPPEQVALGAALHLVFCEVSAKPGPGWSDAHRPADERTAAKVIDALHVAGWQVVPADERSVPMSTDYLDVR